MKRVYIASDHAGYHAKDAVRDFLQKEYKDHVDVVDLGTHDPGVSVDYPLYGEMLAIALAAEPEAFGIAICGTGIGISMALNRHRHVRAALCHTALEARLAREHNNANVAVFGGRILENSTLKECVESFLKTEFSKEGRHHKRVEMMS